MMDYHEHDGVVGLISRFAERQLYDGGFNCQRLLKQKPERKSCFKGSLTGILLYAECKKKNILPSNTEKLLDYFLKRDIFYSSDKSISLKGDKPRWRYVDNFFPIEPLRTGLPLIVYAFSVLGVGNHTAMNESLDLLNEKHDEKGMMILEGSFSKYPYSFGVIGKRINV